ncbi:hypothetical protein ACFVG7_26115, partial [Streptomyces sp. NPDC127112]
MRAEHIHRVLVAVTLLGLTMTACGDQTNAAQRARRHPYAGIEELPEALAPDGTTIVVGDPQRMPVHLYEDMRRPVCKEVEVTGAGGSLLEMTLGKEVRTEYTLSSASDGQLGGTGSKKAVNALRAALEQGKFAEYRAVGGGAPPRGGRAPRHHPRPRRDARAARGGGRRGGARLPPARPGVFRRHCSGPRPPPRKDPAQRLNGLTPRETEVLE